MFLPFWVSIRIGPLSDSPTQAEVALLCLGAKAEMNMLVVGQLLLQLHQSQDCARLGRGLAFMRIKGA